MRKISLGIIGAGRIGRLHAENILSNFRDVRLKAVADIFADKIKDWASQQGIEKVYKDHKDILNDPEIDAVLICSSTDTHAQFIIEAAQQGKHIFCEKPIDLDPKRIKEALEAVKSAGIKLQVGFNRRFDKHFMSLKETIEKGKIGEQHIIRITSRDPAPPPIEYVKVSGGIFLDMTIHDFDMVRYLTGSEVKEVYATAGVMVDPAIGEAGDVDTTVITLKMENGAIAVIDNSRRAVYGYDQRAEVFGSKGCAAIGNEVLSSVVLSSAEGVCGEKPKYFFLERYKDAYVREIKEFIDCIINDTEPLVTGVDGLKPVLIGLAAWKSYKEGRPVRLD